MNKIQDSISLQCNEEYANLQKELETFLKEDDKKKIKATEKEILKVEKKCKKNMLENIKKGLNLVGSLEFKLLHSCPKLRKKWSTWARNRGRNFEDLVLEKFEEYGDIHQDSYPYKNAITKFGFQPYDLIVFFREKAPILLECKASGITKRKDDAVVLQACKRRYEHYTEEQKIERIQKIKKTTNLKLFFIFNNENHQLFYVVNSQLIYANSTHLCGRNIVLREEDYFTLPYDSSEWPKDLYLKFIRL